MVKKFIGFLYQETSSLNQAALLLGLLSLLSQFVGFLRDRLLAHIFGASTELDIYYAAFRIPDFLFVTVASIVSLSVLVPFIIEKDSQGRESLRRFIDNIFSFFSILIFFVAVATYVFMPEISSFLFKGFSAENLLRVVFISRLLLLSPILLGLSNLFGSLTQAYNRFMLYAFAPVLYNAGIVIGVVGFSSRWGIEGVAFGVILGAVMHLVIQIPFIFSSGLIPRPIVGFDWKVIEQVVKISLPRTLTLSMSAITLLFLTAMASRMSDGSVSILNFGNNIQTISLSMIGVSYSLAAFPTLTRKFQEKDMKAFLEQMQVTARFIIFWSLPFTALIFVLRAQIVRVLLGSGLFDWTATRLTAAVVALFVLSTVFQSLILLLMRGFYSAGHTRRPFYINLVSTIFLVVITHGLIKLFYFSSTFHYFITSLLKVEDLSGSAILMLPLGFTLGTLLNGILLWASFEREFRGFSRGVWRTCFEGLGAGFIMAGVTYVALNFFAQIIDGSTLPGIFFQGLFSGVLGIFSGVLVLKALKSVELREVGESLHTKFWKSKVIATDPEIV